MKRLLAKLPRSSSGSRAASASSSASRWPFAIFDVSMTIRAGCSGFALVSSAICFSSASSGDFILPGCHVERSRDISNCSNEYPEIPRLRSESQKWKFERLSLFIKSCLVPGALLQYLAWQEFLFSLRQAFQFRDDLLESKMFGETQRPTTEGRETGSQNHSVVRVFRRIDDFLLHATRRFVHHQEDKPVRDVISCSPDKSG